jgi:hypothetical protein
LSVLQQLSRRVLEKLYTRDGFRRREIIRVLPRDAIRAIDHPVFDVADSQNSLADRERVVGIEINGDCRAYPRNILSVHEIINDEAGGVPIAVTWCPLSHSAVVYCREVEGRPLTLGVSGGILRNVLVMFDRETESCWNQISGESFSGPLSGLRLQALPVVDTTWERWAEERPATRVLSKKNCPYRHYEEDHMADYYRSSKTGIRPAVNRDGRLPEKEMVMGLAGSGTPRAYPYSLLDSARVLHDEVEGVPLVAFYEVASGTATLFRAKSEGSYLSFYEAQGEFFDCLTGSRWSPLSGEALAGPLRGRRLQAEVALSAYWFAWADHYPGSEVYSLPNIQ